MLAPSKNGRHRVKNYFYAGNAYLLKGQNNTTNKMYPVEHKTLPPPYNNKKDEDISGGRRKNGSCASTC